MPSPFDEKAKAAYLRRIEEGRMPRSAAADIGFSWSTIQRHLRDDQEFATAYDDAVARRIERIEEVVLEQAEDGHFGSQKFVLERLRSDQWGDKSKMVGSGSSGQSITNVAIVTTDALRELLSGEQAAEALQTVTALPVIDAEVVDG